jgi:hypothetical protein
VKKISITLADNVSSNKILDEDENAMKIYFTETMNQCVNISI